jgi:hypothetical protein
VEDVLDELAAEGLGEATLKGARNALAAMLSDAVRARKLSANVATAARLPEDMPDRKARVVPTPAQVVDLIDATRSTDLGAIVVLLAGTGARIGEALAATWASLNLDAGTWTISRTVTRDEKGSAVLGARTKTGDSRVVALPDDAVDALKEQRKRVAAARLAVGEAWADLDLVFPTSIGTVVDLPTTLVGGSRRPLPASLAASMACGTHSPQRRSQCCPRMRRSPRFWGMPGSQRRSTSTGICGRRTRAPWRTRSRPNWRQRGRSDRRVVGYGLGYAGYGPTAICRLTSHVVRPEGLEPPTSRVETGCSIH